MSNIGAAYRQHQPTNIRRESLVNRVIRNAVVAANRVGTGNGARPERRADHLHRGNR